MPQIQLQTTNVKNKKMKLTNFSCNRDISTPLPEQEHIICNDNSQFQQELLIEIKKLSGFERLPTFY